MKILKSYKLELIVIIIAVIVGSFLQFEDIFTPINRQEVSKLFSQSQYILGEASPNKVSDETVYEYAALEYSQGNNPVEVNFEHPPLGKYFFSLSLILFNSTKPINILFFLLIVVNFFLILKNLISQTWIRALSIVALSSFSLVISHLSKSLLDLQLLAWTLIFFNLLFSQFNHRFIKHSLIGLTLGAIASTKYFFPLIGLYLLIYLLYQFFENKNILQIVKELILATISALGVYLLTYSAYFLSGNNLIDLIKFEIYRFHWWTGARDIPKFMILDTIVRGRFKYWWTENEYEYATHWTPIWPLMLLLQLLASLFGEWTTQKKLLFIYPNLLLSMLAFGAAANERYVLQLLPFWIILIALGINNLIKKKLIKPN